MLSGRCCGAMLTWLRKASIGIMAAATVMVCSLLVVTPAQSAPTSGQADVSWEAATVTAGEVGTQAICSTRPGSHRRGSWYIIGTCPPGTLRDDEGIYYYD